MCRRFTVNVRFVITHHLLAIPFIDDGNTSAVAIYKILQMYHDAPILYDILYMTSTSKFQARVQHLILCNQWLVLQVDHLHLISANFWRNLVYFSDDELRALNAIVDRRAHKPFHEAMGSWAAAEAMSPFSCAVFSMWSAGHWRELYWMMNLRTRRPEEYLFPRHLFFFFVEQNHPYWCRRVSLVLGAFHGRVGSSSALYRHFTRGLFGEQYVLQLIFDMVWGRQ